MDKPSQTEGATPGNDNPTGQAALPGEPSGTSATLDQENNQPLPEDPSNEDPDENDPLHKALKAERQTVKDLKASNSALSAKLAEYETADLQRKTAELITKAGLSPNQADALATLKTFEEREAMAAVMNQPFLRKTIAGLAPKQTFHDRLLARGLSPEAIGQINDEIGRNHSLRMRYDDMDEDSQFDYMYRRAKQRGFILAGKKTTPVY